MRQAEARACAETRVFCDFNMRDIEAHCLKRGILIVQKNGKKRSRSEMESDLIDAMTEEMTNE